VIIYTTNYTFNLYNEIHAIMWEAFKKNRAKDGVHCVHLPPKTKRLNKISYDLYRMGDIRIDAATGDTFYDWVQYGESARVVTGYFLYLPDGVDPLPVQIAPPQALSRTAQAVELVRNGMSQAQAARALGLSYVGVHVAVKRAGVAAIPRGLSRTAQAVEWLRAEPGRTHNAAAVLFGISRATVTIACNAAPK
jgi:hypothetical protein